MIWSISSSMAYFDPESGTPSRLFEIILRLARLRESNVSAALPWPTGWTKSADSGGGESIERGGLG